MRLSMARRALASLLMCWLPLAGPEGRLVHGCGSGDHAMATGRHDAEHAHHADLTGHAHHADLTDPVHHANETGPAHQAPEPPSHDPASSCDCVGTCCPATPLAPRSPATLNLATIRVVDSAVPGRPAHAVVAAWVDFVLPFATAPPVAVRS
jgi:hypothetical protein